RFAEDGKLIEKISSGFVETDKGTYYLDKNGEKVHGWKEIDGRIYYFSTSNTGYMRTGKTKIAGTDYQFDSKGRLPKGVKFGFNKEKDGTYYLSKDEGRLRGWQEIDGNKYYFSMSQTSYMRTGKARIDGKEYEFTKDGKLIEDVKTGFV